MSGPQYIPSISSNGQGGGSLEFAWPALTVGDAVDQPSYNIYALFAKYFGVQVQNEILGAQAMSVADKTWQLAYTCGSSDAVGSAVRISGNATVTTAKSDTSVHAKVIGFIRFKGALGATSDPAGTTCYLQNFVYVTGLSGGTAGNDCYLTDTGGYSATAGTVAKVVGKFTSATTAILVALPNAGEISGTDIISGSAASGTPLLADGAGGSAFSGTTRVQNGGTGAATLGTSKQPVLGNGTGALTAAAAPTTPDANADVIFGTSAASKKAVVIQGSVNQTGNILEIQSSDGLAQFAINLGAATRTGPNNTNLGVNAGPALTLGSNNTNVGVNAGSAITAGSYNTNVGSLAGAAEVAGTDNVAVGKEAFTAAAGANDKQSVAVGSTALKATNASSGNNTAAGFAAGVANTTGSNNTFVGASAGATNTTGANNVVIGSGGDTHAATGVSNAIVLAGATGVKASATSIVIATQAVDSSTANDLIVRSGDTGMSRKAAGRLQSTDGSGNSTGDIVPNARAINYMINGAFDVNQRVPDALTTISGIVLGTDKYSADRWKVSGANADVQFQRVDTNGALESGYNARYYGTYKKITNAGKLMAYQVIESKNTFPLASRVVTVQFKIKSSASATFRVGLIQANSSATVDAAITTLVPTTWGAASTDPTLTTNYATIAPTRVISGLTGTITGNALSCATTTAWALFGGAFTVPSNAKNLIVAIWSDSNMAINDTVSIGEIALYDGAGVRDWVPTLYEEELARCQRYSWVTPLSGKFASGWATSTTAVQIWGKFPVTMRAAPTSTSSGGSTGFIVTDSITGTATINASSGLSGSNHGTETFSLAGTTTASGYTAHWPIILGCNDGVSIIVFDADF